MGRTRAPYPVEFREQLVTLVRAGRSPDELAEEFEPSAQTIRNWVAQAAADRGERELAGLAWRALPVEVRARERP